MATSQALPNNCPVCGFVFGVLGIEAVQGHFLAHLMVYFANSAIAQADAPRDPSTDW